MRHRKDRRRPKVTMYPDGTVTLSGLSYRNARWMLDMARLYLYDHEFKPEPEEGNLSEVIKENNQCGAREERWIIWCIESLHQGIMDAITEDHRKHGASWLQPKPLKQILQERTQKRETINRITEQVLNEIRNTHAK